MAVIMFSPKLQAFSKVTLAKPWASDFAAAWAHPKHDNEAIAYDETYDMWVILDCCGDQYNFATLDEALSEFVSPEGHAMWEETRRCGQHWKPMYFAKANS